MTDQQRHIYLKAVQGQALSADERSLLDDWLAESDGRQAQLEDAKWTWERAGEEVTAGEEEVAAAWRRIEGEMAEDARGANRWWWAAAAGVALLIFIGLLWSRFDGTSSEEWRLLTQTQDRTQALRLADGSEIVLFPASSLWLHKDFLNDNRKVKLEGEAFFDITQHASLPFVAQGQTFQAQVLGTQFYFQSDSTSSELNVVEGVVRFSQVAQPGQADTLHAHESARSLPDMRIVRAPEALLQLPPTQSQKWAFNDTPLRTIFKRLTLSFHLRFQLEDPALGNCRFTGHFENPTAEDILSAIQRTQGQSFDYQIENGAVKISGNACLP